MRVDYDVCKDVESVFVWLCERMKKGIDR